MSLTADFVVESRQLRRRASFWRIAAFAIAGLAVLALGVLFAPGGFSAGGPFIARIKIAGVIAGEETTLKLIRDVEKSSASAVILAIDSPGGTTTGSEELYLELRKLAGKKPVAAVVSTMAASGAYIAALGADRIFVRGNSIVGSIGVLVAFPNFSGLMEKVGVQYEEIKSSPLKASPNGFEPTTPEARAALAALVTDSYVWFKDLVKDRRHLTDAELAIVSDGRVFTARMGLPLKLVDRLGGEREAIAWLESEKSIAKGLPVQDYKAEPSLGRFGFLGASADIADWSGLPDIARMLRRSQGTADARMLDGLVVIWHGGE